jgi:hypothetical protein
MYPEQAHARFGCKGCQKPGRFESGDELMKVVVMDPHRGVVRLENVTKYSVKPECFAVGPIARQAMKLLLNVSYTETNVES